MDDSNIPIDINIGKLQDWLISRRHVNKDWQKNILSVREKINNAIQDMPAHEGIASLLSGSYINYFHCLKIVDILKETEADTKNIFGRYGSQRMKDWQDVIKNYENNNLYLAEAAQMLERNIKYEIPSLKKQIAKEEQIQAECEKKSADYQKNEASMRAEYQTACRQLGVQGDNIKRELFSLLKDLPDMYDKIARSLPPILPAISLYAAFHRYIRGDTSDPLLLLKFVAERGNTTVYEWTYGEPPLSVEVDQEKHVREETEASNTNEIDFGDGGGDIDFGDGSEIDFGDGAVDIGLGYVASAGEQNADIDFGEGGEIDWGDVPDGVASEQDISRAIETISLEESGIVVEAGGVAGGVARGREAATLLDNPATKTLFAEQLVELESFLKMRLYEASSSDAFGLSLLAELPPETPSALTAMLDAVQVSLGLATDLKLTRLHSVKHSPRYADVLAGQLKQKLALCEKLSKLGAEARERGKESASREGELRPLLANMVARSQELQTEIEKDISRKYKGRPVNIIGGVKFL